MYVATGLDELLTFGKRIYFTDGELQVKAENPSCPPNPLISL